MNLRLTLPAHKERAAKDSPSPPTVPRSRLERSLELEDEAIEVLDLGGRRLRLRHDPLVVRHDLEGLAVDVVVEPSADALLASGELQNVVAVVQELVADERLQLELAEVIARVRVDRVLLGQDVVGPVVVED